ncbi:MAG: MerR family transcriptional regulator [Streptosporangiales bacterium]|nr:MerR family transcriptional regulator [Streptosporangiales bacterium]
MRISELSRSSGVPVATIKYYLREGLLPKGEATAATQARYDATHLRRLRLIRALVEVGEVPLAAIHRVLKAVDDPDLEPHEMLGVAHYAISGSDPAARERTEPGYAEVRARADALLRDLGWRVEPGAPDRDELAAVLLRLRDLGLPMPPGVLAYLAGVAQDLATHEVRWIDDDAPREILVEQAVARTVLFERALLALNRLALEDASARHFGTARAHGSPRDGTASGSEGGATGNDDGSAAERADGSSGNADGSATGGRRR